MIFQRSFPPSNLPPDQMTAHSGTVNWPSGTMVDLRQTPGACPYCSTPTVASYHSGSCPRVRAIEYHPDGSVKRIEFKTEMS